MLGALRGSQPRPAAPACRRQKLSPSSHLPSGTPSHLAPPALCWGLTGCGANTQQCSQYWHSPNVSNDPFHILFLTIIFLFSSFLHLQPNYTPCFPLVGRWGWADGWTRKSWSSFPTLMIPWLFDLPFPFSLLLLHSFLGLRTVTKPTSVYDTIAPVSYAPSKWKGAYKRKHLYTRTRASPHEHLLRLQLCSERIQTLMIFFFP